MNPTENPFIIKGEIPEELFCDRISERDTLTRLLLNGNNVVLTSNRRVGKTGLINFCFNQKQIQDNHYTIFCDILETSSLKEFTYILGKRIFDTLKPKSKKMMELFIRTVRSLSGEFTIDITTGLPKFSFSFGNITNPEYTLDEIFEYIDKADKRCIIAIDEFQQITRYPEKNIEAILRTHIQHCKNADFIFAGSERHILAEMFNSYSRPFYASTSALGLDEIPLEKYAEFAIRLFSNYNKLLTNDVVESVYSKFSGNTFCMQKCFNTAFSITKENGTCTVETIDAAIDDILAENEHSYRLRLSLLSNRNKELLFAIAKEGVAEQITSGKFIRKHALQSSSSVQTSAKQLLADDWITLKATNNGKQYRLTDYFLMLWIVKNY
ncbi:MAG: ATPase [Paludibacteraceae bacterium]|nr:ATPase [Paludibacteraceae bacterium]